MRGSGIRNNFLGYRTKVVKIIAQRNAFYIHYWLQLKQNLYSIGIVLAPVETHIVKVHRKIAKSPSFES